MSIWSSLQLPGLGDLPVRDNYTGKQTDATIFLDVASALGHHDCARLCVGNEEIVLSIDEINALIDALSQVRFDIEDWEKWHR